MNHFLSLNPSLAWLRPPGGARAVAAPPRLALASPGLRLSGRGRKVFGQADRRAAAQGKAEAYRPSPSFPSPPTHHHHTPYHDYFLKDLIREEYHKSRVSIQSSSHRKNALPFPARSEEGRPKSPRMQLLTDSPPPSLSTFAESPKKLEKPNHTKDLDQLFLLR